MTTSDALTREWEQEGSPERPLALPEAAAEPAARPRWPARSIMVAAAGWLAFVITHRLISGRWWAWLFPDLVPPLTFVAVPVLLLGLLPLAAGRRRWTAGLAATALLLGAGISGLNPAVLFDSPPPAPADALRVVSFNTTVWNHRDGRPDEMFTMLRGLDADVYLLQEYKPYDEVTGLSVDPGRLRHEFPGYEIVLRGELVTLSRLPVVATRALPLDPPAGSDWQTDYWEIKTLRTDLRVGDEIVSVYNVHMLVLLDVVSPFTASFWRTRRDWDGRRQRQYAGLENDLRANSQPIVLAGDFNTSPAMGDLRAVAGRLDDAAVASDSIYPTSWKTDWLELWRVDWAFTSPDITVHRYDLVDHSSMSDHRLQDLTLSLRTTG